MKTKLEKVDIRMYRQGLGDCFLLTFHYNKTLEPYHMLIDCGVLIGTEDGTKIMQSVAADIDKKTKGKIDTLVATHEHWDHLSGFLQATDIFEAMQIAEIWMAWTEDPSDQDAVALKETHGRKLRTIRMAYERLKENNSISQKQHSAFSSFFSLFGTEEHGVPNKEKRTGTYEAFEKLKKRAHSKKKYCLPGHVITRESKLPGVRFYVLGPPKDRKMLRKSNPSAKNSEIYAGLATSAFGDNIFYALASETEGSPDGFTPFGIEAGIPENEIDDYRAKNKTGNWEIDIYEQYTDEKNKWRQIETDWLNLAGRLAIYLDNGINNTSLALAIELTDSGKILLFPADAQVGNWLSWKNLTWEIREDNTHRKVTIDELFAKTVFYKVGHHGSHNATLKDDGLEKMTNENLIAMIPVDQKVADKKGWKMPYKKLHQLLKEKTHANVIIADEEHNDSGTTTALYHEITIKN